MRSPARPSRGLITIAVVLGAAWTLTAAARANDERVLACAAAPSANVASVFDVPRAEHLLELIPKFGKAPELEGNKASASVVIFRGPTEVRYPGRANLDPNAVKATETVSNIVCVVIDGVPTYYANIDLSGYPR